MILSTLFIFILWTWGLTPVWVNVLGTVLLSLKLIGSTVKVVSAFLDVVSKYDEE